MPLRRQKEALMKGFGTTDTANIATPLHPNYTARKIEPMSLAEFSIFVGEGVVRWVCMVLQMLLRAVQGGTQT